MCMSIKIMISITISVNVHVNHHISKSACQSNILLTLFEKVLLHEYSVHSKHKIDIIIARRPGAPYFAFLSILVEVLHTRWSQNKPHLLRKSCPCHPQWIGIQADSVLMAHDVKSWRRGWRSQSKSVWLKSRKSKFGSRNFNSFKTRIPHSAPIWGSSLI